jgi:hypothetical protein
MKKSFKILTSGYGFEVINIFWDRIQNGISYPIIHVLHPAIDISIVTDKKFESVSNHYCLRDSVKKNLPKGDVEYLATLEAENVPTIHNMILCDSVLSKMKYDDAISYATYIAKEFENIFLREKPNIVVSGFDAFHSSMSKAVANKLNIKWLALSFSVLPKGFMGFTSTMNNSGTFSVIENDQETIRRLASESYNNFIIKQMHAPTIISESSLKVILQKIPYHLKHLSQAIIQLVTSRFDRYTRRPISTSIYDYFRRKINLLSLNILSLEQSPSSDSFFFIGLHMQPEMAIDVWAPFYSNQINVIETIARSIPPNFKLCVKLHKIDSDNFSLLQLKKLQLMPGVILVSPFASSRDYIEKASLIFSIQGTIALEAALLGKPVISFGKTAYIDMPTVVSIKDITELPSQIRQILASKTKLFSKEKILDGYFNLLNRYSPACYNDWTVCPTENEINNCIIQFEALSKLNFN